VQRGWRLREYWFGYSPSGGGCNDEPGEKATSC
jgi:hypothetical protein